MSFVFALQTLFGTNFRRRGDSKIDFLHFEGGGIWGAERKLSKNTASLGKRHDNNILKVQIGAFCGGTKFRCPLFTSILPQVNLCLPQFYLFLKNAFFLLHFKRG